MLYNNWSDPEIEMIDAAISDFVEEIPEDELHFLKRLEGSNDEEYQAELESLFDELLQEYGIEYTENSYLDFCDELEDQLI